MRTNSLKIIQGACKLLNSEQETPKILAQFCKYLSCSFGVPTVAVCTFESRDNRMSVRGSYGLYMDEIQTFLPIGTLTEQAFREGRSVNTILSPKQQKIIDPYMSGLLARCNSVIVNPLHMDGKPFGTLTLCRSSRTVFPKWIAETCAVLASPLAGFLHGRDRTHDRFNDNAANDLAYSGHSGEEKLCIPVTSPGSYMAGKPIVTGCGWGKATILTGDTALVEPQLSRCDHPETQTARLNEAYTIARAALKQCKEEICRVISEADASIFDMHIMLLDDPTLRERIGSYISSGYTLEASLALTFKAFQNDFKDIEDEYLRERLQDVEDVLLRLLNAAGNQPTTAATNDDEFTVLIARELFPSQLVSLPFQQISGIICESGGATSHAAILARALRIPMVVNIPEIQRNVHSGDTVLVDGINGLCFLSPADSVIKHYEPSCAFTRRCRECFSDTEAAQIDDTPCTLDGTPIKLCGNVTLTSEINALHSVGIQEVGLYRTEFMFMIRNSMPDEQTQYDILRKLIENAGGAPIAIRALDIGGDKPLPYIKWAPELNPSLGWRGLRFLLSNPEIARPHLRAILRACTSPNAALLFPMVSDKSDIVRAKAAVQDAAQSLETDRLPYGIPKIGMMLEVPSAIACLDQLLPEVDFLSIGTNDLIQYLFAVDRGNALVSRWFNACHPVVFRLIGTICSEVAKYPGKELELCGELAGQILALPVLLGAGLRKLSMNSAVIPRIREYIRKLDLAECQKCYRHLCQCDDAGEIRKKLEAFLSRHS